MAYAELARFFPCAQYVPCTTVYGSRPSLQISLFLFTLSRFYATLSRLAAAPRRETASLMRPAFFFTAILRRDIMVVDATMHLTRPGRRNACLDWLQMLTGALLIVFMA